MNIRLVSRPARRPGSCICCQQTYTQARYLDTGRTLKNRDRVYVCSICVQEFNKLLGSPTDEAHADLIAHADHLTVSLAGVQAERDELAAQLEVAASSAFKNLVAKALPAKPAAAKPAPAKPAAKAGK